MKTGNWPPLAFLVLRLLAPLSAKGYDDDYYYGSGDHDYAPTAEVKFCRIDADCLFTSAPRCCTNTNTCCNTQLDDTYKGAKTLCLNEYRLYTGVECPRSSDFSKIYCCYGGRFCCNHDDHRLISRFHNTDESNNRYPNHRGTDGDHSGVPWSLGAIAGFVFLAVIIAGTLLTLATRYIKIKVRREHRRAGIHSQAYIDAINRRANQNDERDAGYDTANNSNAASRVTSQPRASEIFYIESIPEEEEEEEEEEDDVGPPPSYDEALATCPVVDQEESEQRPEESQENQSRNYLFRPSVRPSRTPHSIFEHSSLSVVKNNIEPNRDQAEIERNETNSITLPKEGDSQA